MLAMALSEADRFDPLRWPVRWFFCGPMGTIGIAFLLAANLGRSASIRPPAPPPLTQGVRP